MGTVLNFFNRVQGWFIHKLSIVFQPITIRNKTIIIMSQAIEDVNGQSIKDIILAQSLEEGVADFIYKMTRQAHNSKKWGKKGERCSG